ncbi:MAG: hypothetical protein ACREHG_11135, partial [Candidatus Saccharimonadales bacterium]
FIWKWQKQLTVNWCYLHCEEGQHLHRVHMALIMGRLMQWKLAGHERMDHATVKGGLGKLMMVRWIH